MGSSGTKTIKKEKERKDEKCFENEPIPFDTFDKIRKSVCKIIYMFNSRLFHGTGFFYGI